MNPLIRKAIGPDGREIKAFRNQHLKAVNRRLSKYDCVDMTVCFGTGTSAFECRLIVHPNLCAHDTPRYLVTNLHADNFSPEQVSRRLPITLADRIAVQGVEVAREPANV